MCQTHDKTNINQELFSWFVATVTVFSEYLLCFELIKEELFQSLL